MKMKNQSEVVEQHLIQHWMYFQHTKKSVKVDTSEIKWISASPYNRGIYAGTRHIEPALGICPRQGRNLYGLLVHLHMITLGQFSIKTDLFLLKNGSE